MREVELNVVGVIMKIKYKERFKNLINNIGDYASALAFSAVGLYVWSTDIASPIMLVIGTALVGFGIADYIRVYDLIKKREAKEKKKLTK